MQYYSNNTDNTTAMEEDISVIRLTLRRPIIAETMFSLWKKQIRNRWMTCGIEIIRLDRGKFHYCLRSSLYELLFLVKLSH